MPIANCFVSSKCIHGENDLIGLWSQDSGHPSEHMTVNIIKCDEQLGKQYAIIATLYVPSLLSEKIISDLQTGLAKALSHYYNLSTDSVFIMTTIIDSGKVVESGQEQRW